MIVKRGASFFHSAAMRPLKMTLVAVVLTPVVVLYPFVGTLVSAWFRALGMSRVLHRRVRCAFGRRVEWN